ncbi:NAD(P)H-quinone oxidoreductase [Marinivivus vitaminiproducens]|uniref:NAD(P)H-quinone oxidoreductase n=1 Tax=Marinivivus vitaminiproducens TaxID=3035935 RepID=UPI0027AB0F2A|nr:NAD(P)H-quinone oxidoreductase [Geminicoccaceae bacterium SCSIO 64248]
MKTLPTTMRAVIATAPGGPDVLQVVERPVPAPADGQVLVRVMSAGVNRPDVAQRQGYYPPPPGASNVLGLEIAGEVVAKGRNTGHFNFGQMVMGLIPGGGYADYAVVHESNALPVPKTLSTIEAGAVPETFFTVWTNVFDRGRLQPGETLLVHGGSSGIGTTAIMLAKALGSKVIVTAGSDAKCRACLDLGADVAINYREQDFVEEARKATDGKGVDVILDMVGGDYTARNLKLAALNGRIVQIALLGGSKAQIDLGTLMTRRLTLTGSTLRVRSPEEKAVIARALEQSVVPLWSDGRCRPVIDRTFPLDRVRDAHERIDGGQHIGKIVLEVAS